MAVLESSVPDELEVDARGMLPDELKALLSSPRTARRAPSRSATGLSTARLHGFDLRDAPVLSGLASHPGQLVPALTTVALRQSMIGAAGVVLHPEDDRALPIILGVVQESGNSSQAMAAPSKGLEVQADDERLVLTAEREIVLRCGDASITLTRAGKVVIRGNYIVSRSSGVNKIKGAAIDLN